jgi:hypothetical protein
VAKHDFLLRRGVQGLIDSRADGIVDRVQQLTGGRGGRSRARCAWRSILA